MMFENIGRTVEFWVAVSMALLAKILLTEAPLSTRQKVATIVSGVLASLFGTEYAATYFEVSGVNGLALVAAVLAITGEHFVRALITMGPTIARTVINSIMVGKKFLRFVQKEEGPTDEK